MIIYNNIISLENLYEAWSEFVRGKKHKEDVALFSLNLIENIYLLHLDLKDRTYIHGEYKHFVICDPKRRDIHKACVRDRLLHHAIYRVLYPYFDTLFIHDSYSCRNDKGTHRAMNRFRDFAGKVSKNHTRTCWVLKCDIRKFFASIDHGILIRILEERIENKEIMWLFNQVISSFHSGKEKVGLPLGNLTSQLLVNIYMNEFDQYMKRGCQVKYYIRYADDFVILSEDRRYVEELSQKIEDFLTLNLKLSLHPNKVSITTFASGIDFLGFVHFPHHRVLRMSTKRRMIRRVSERNVESYKGLLSHGDTYGLKEVIESIILQKERVSW